MHKPATPPPPPRRNSGLCHVCTGGRQYKAQKENGLVSGLYDHRYLSVAEDETRRCLWVGHRDAKQWVCSGTPVADAKLYPLDL